MYIRLNLLLADHIMVYALFTGFVNFGCTMKLSLCITNEYCVVKNLFKSQENVAACLERTFGYFLYQNKVIRLKHSL